LRRDREYISIWGYWNGPDDKLAARDGNYLEGINALRAWREGIISKEEYVSLMQQVREDLLAAGVEDLNLRGSHILLSRRRNTIELIRDHDGVPKARICTFELLRMSGDWEEQDRYGSERGKCPVPGTRHRQNDCDFHPVYRSGLVC